MMKELSKAEEIARCQDTVTRLILAFRGLDKHDRSGRTKLDLFPDQQAQKHLTTPNLRIGAGPFFFWLRG